MIDTCGITVEAGIVDRTISAHTVYTIVNGLQHSSKALTLLL